LEDYHLFILLRAKVFRKFFQIRYFMKNNLLYFRVSALKNGRCPLRVKSLGFVVEGKIEEEMEVKDKMRLFNSNLELL